MYDFYDDMEGKKKKKARKKRESGAEILASFGAKYDPILFPF